MKPVEICKSMFANDSKTKDFKGIGTSGRRNFLQDHYNRWVPEIEAFRGAAAVLYSSS